MGQWQFHTPEGVMDYLPEECSLKRRLENKLRSVFNGRGYDEIETPGIEFYDVYAGSEEFTPQETLFKFFDHKGRILCLRYDGTVPAARIAATICRDVKPPLRFSYLGNMYRFNEAGGGRQREFTQGGLELMGLDTPEADAEMIAAAIESARELGIEDLQVSVGQVSFFKGLIEKWSLDDAAACQLQQMIDTRETVALDELIRQFGLSEADQKILELMMNNDGSTTVIDRLLAIVDYEPCSDALNNLKSVLSVLDDYELMPYISIDLGMLQSINYYTGIIFKGFTYGLGFPLFSGGRYNGAVAAFGRDLSATGFSIGINFVMSALRRQGLIEQRKQDIVRLLYPDNLRKAAYTAADRWRRDGFRIVCEKISSENNMFPKNEGIVSDTSAESLESAFAGIENYESVIVIMEKQDKIRIYCKEC
jgi:ATP phosphoribosyltransferase regulatory subunit